MTDNRKGITGKVEVRNGLQDETIILAQGCHQRMDGLYIQFLLRNAAYGSLDQSAHPVLGVEQIRQLLLVVDGSGAGHGDEIINELFSDDVALKEGLLYQIHQVFYRNTSVFQRLYEGMMLPLRAGQKGDIVKQHTLQMRGGQLLQFRAGLMHQDALKRRDLTKY